MVCIFVRRGDFRQYDRLHQAFGERVPVLWDRRRRSASPVEGDDAGTRNAGKNAGRPLRLVGSPWDLSSWTVLASNHSPPGGYNLLAPYR